MAHVSSWKMNEMCVGSVLLRCTIHHNGFQSVEVDHHMCCTAWISDYMALLVEISHAVSRLFFCKIHLSYRSLTMFCYFRFMTGES